MQHDEIVKTIADVDHAAKLLRSIAPACVREAADLDHVVELLRSMVPKDVGYGSYNVTFRPFLTIKVKDMQIEGLTWDWNDTLENVQDDSDGDLLWEQGTEPTGLAADITKVACEYVDTTIAGGKTER